MRCFLQVVQSGGFSAAARDMGRSKALVSKYVSELEDELGVRLLNRTTRQLSLTEAGQVFHREAADILQRIDDLSESIQHANQAARGLLRVSAPRSMGDDMLTRAIMDFVVAEPEISIDLRLEDRFVDLVDEGYDVAIRVSDLADSSLIARKLLPIRGVVCATPEVLRQHGIPERPQDLANLPCIIDTNYRFRSNWVFQSDGARVSIQVKGRVEVNSAQSAREAALRNLGFLRTPEGFVHRELQDGRLVEVLQEFQPQDQAIYAVYPHRRHLSGKVRAFVDYLADWFNEARKRGEIC
ncbi:LysR family transcriptional regulator [Stappia sp. F7233]|uniref:LysR family transcriptional regulator n=2 Tax=Stappia albiluteola TaxID=2758565 RepID=A0A839ACY0_9HYPH|nr:LysR family transcriptional regulator [Stappia albiluteola]